MNQALAARPTPIIKLIGDACNEILANRQSLPSMPDVAFRIHAAMKNPDWSIGKVADVVRSDPGTTAYLLRIANSALYAGVTRIVELNIAISRLGMENTRNLVMAHALRSMYVTNSPLLGKLMQQTWQSSAQLAALSAVLARSCPHISPDRALLAGLLQDIGVLPILNVLRQFEQQLTDEAQIHQAVERYAARVGMVLLMQWGFEADMVEVAKSRGSWLRDPGPNPDLSDLVLVARLHQHIAAGRGAQLPDMDQVPAYSKLPFGALSDDGSLALLHDNAEDVSEVMQLLGAGDSA